jgi:hypothetical protein
MNLKNLIYNYSKYVDKDNDSNEYFNIVLTKGLTV